MRNGPAFQKLEIWQGNIHCSVYVVELNKRIENPFRKDVFVAIEYIFTTIKLDSVDDIRSLPLWFNK